MNNVPVVGRNCIKTAKMRNRSVEDEPIGILNLLSKAAKMWDVVRRKNKPMGEKYILQD